MIIINNLSLTFGTRKLFDQISLTINNRQRIGLVGRNGTGKSTLLKLIIEATEKRAPAISVQNDTKIGYLPQEVVLHSSKSIIDETFDTFSQVSKKIKRIKEIEELLAQSKNPDLVHEYAELQADLQDFNVGAALSETKQVLVGLGFKEEQFDKPVKDLSVGWRMRVILAKLLLKKADFYLFDEPTNHLDIVAQDWFLQFLKKAPFGFIMVSHDRYFLNQLTEYTLELELGNAKLYTGNYNEYERQKEEDLLRLETAYKEQQREIKRKQESIDRFRAKSSKAKMAQSMIKALDRMEKIELPPSPRDVHFNFPEIQKSGRVVLKIHDVAQSFGSKEIFKDANFHIERGQKVALVAANGVGKTTLFNIIVGKLALQNGEVEFGHNVNSALFEQDQAESLHLNKTILDNIHDQHPQKSEQQIRSFLGSFLFSADDVQKKVKVLSGGEKNKVGMTNVLLSDANFLLLDEPTNHLDMQAKEVLLKALKAYQGTILFVSHDHDFINKLATYIIELTPNGTYKYHGNYDDFLSQKTAQKESGTKPKPLKNTDKEKEEIKKQYEQTKKSKSLERKIEKLEKEIRKTELSFVDAEYGTEKFNKLEKKRKELEQELSATFQEWEEIQKEF